MRPTISRLLLEDSLETEDALDSRLRQLTVEQSESEDLLLAMQERETKRECIFLRNAQLLSTLEGLIDQETDVKEFKIKATEAIERGYNKTISTEEFYRFLIKYGVKGRTKDNLT